MDKPCPPEKPLVNVASAFAASALTVFGMVLANKACHFYDDKKKERKAAKLKFGFCK